MNIAIAKPRSGHEVSHTPNAVDGPCPCDECPTAAKCAAHRTCCLSFERFVDGHDWQGVSQDPCRRRYLRIFDDAPDDCVSDAERALIEAKGNMAVAARALGVAHQVLRRELIRLGVSS